MNKKNKTVFVITEYNPFHFGHQYQLFELKKRYDTVICVMSGDVVQRGECAVYSKYARAEAAVRLGADCVFELPFPFSCMSARDFAYGGVLAATALGCKNLAFGAEDSLENIVSAVDCFPDKELIDRYIKSNRNISYPKAVSSLIAKNSSVSVDMSLPNNILAVEYIRASRALGADLKFDVVLRDNRFESSSQIRKSQNILDRIPKEASLVFSKYTPRNMSRLDSAIMSAARTLDPDSDVYGLDKSDLFRLKNCARNSKNADETAKNAVCSTMTLAKARRGLFCNLLKITSKDVEKKPCYLRLLALSENGAEYISKNKKNFSIPYISEDPQIKPLGSKALAQLERETNMSQIIALTDSQPIISNNFNIFIK